ncbi:MAG TPA: hypothetical protein ENK11_08945 [Phycisphaerales bacterium]|nr:hypothetical protein [Phycisphaerales bacterium]
MDPEAVISKLREIAPALQAEYRFAHLGVFGSVARGEFTPDSDVDIFIAFEPGERYTLMTLAKIVNALEAALGMTVDIVTDHPGLRPHFRAIVERDLIRVA